VPASSSRLETARLGTLVRIPPATEQPVAEADVPALDDRLWKRSLDIVAAGLLLLVSLPLWPIIALLIKLTSPGPVLYVQAAVGRGGRTFRFYKFRSMRAGADNAIHRHYIARFVRGSNGGGSAGTGDLRKMEKDARVTAVGRWLRRTSLDELPQLLNVLRGDMSLVGPRPPLPYEYVLYDDWARRRLAIRPGITGLYQVTRRSRASFREMVVIDLDYVERRSLWLDLSIMARTLPAMLLGRGAC
jgi:lipopolysaccharide/colanic/teichoic acid biosynthesis glycosyltransferase